MEEESSGSNVPEDEADPIVKEVLKIVAQSYNIL